MKIVAVVLLLAALASSFEIPLKKRSLTYGVYNYLNRIGIPEAQRIKKLEDEITKIERVAGGSTTTLLSVPYQAGLILTINVLRTAVCGATIISDIRILTGAHCYNDGNNVVQSITVVLGSNLLFSGGTRITATDVVMHPGYNPWIAANDLAIIRVSRITFGTFIQPISLPSGSELNDNFAGRTALLSGYGVTRQSDSVGLLQTISSVNLQVMNNAECAQVYPTIVQSHHLCTSGAGGVGACPGDTGGPLVLTNNFRRILIGISSFTSPSGCQSGQPSGYTRITAFVSWILSI